MTSPWLTTLLSGFVALTVAWVTVHLDRRKTVNQELIKKRIGIYDAIVPKANDLICCFTCVGNWRDLPLDRIIQTKREIDRTFHVYGDLLSKEFQSAYHDFMNAGFATYQGAGKPAALRANREHLRRQWGEEWKPTWDTLFVGPSEVVRTGELRRVYRVMIEQLAVEIGAVQPPRFPHFRKRISASRGWLASWLKRPLSSRLK